MSSDTSFPEGLRAIFQQNTPSTEETQLKSLFEESESVRQAFIGWADQNRSSIAMNSRLYTAFTIARDIETNTLEESSAVYYAKTSRITYLSAAIFMRYLYNSHNIESTLSKTIYNKDDKAIIQHNIPLIIALRHSGIVTDQQLLSILTIRGPNNNFLLRDPVLFEQCVPLIKSLSISNLTFLNEFLTTVDATNHTLLQDYADLISEDIKTQLSKNARLTTSPKTLVEIGVEWVHHLKEMSQHFPYDMDLGGNLPLNLLKECSDSLKNLETATKKDLKEVARAIEKWELWPALSYLYKQLNRENVALDGSLIADLLRIGIEKLHSSGATEQYALLGHDHSLLTPSQIAEQIKYADKASITKEQQFTSDFSRRFFSAELLVPVINRPKKEILNEAGEKEYNLKTKSYLGELANQGQYRKKIIPDPYSLEASQGVCAAMSANFSRHLAPIIPYQGSEAQFREVIMRMAEKFAEGGDADIVAAQIGYLLSISSQADLELVTLKEELSAGEFNLLYYIFSHFQKVRQEKMKGLDLAILLPPLRHLENLTKESILQDTELQQQLGITHPSEVEVAYSLYEKIGNKWQLEFNIQDSSDDEVWLYRLDIARRKLPEPASLVGRSTVLMPDERAMQMFQIFQSRVFQQAEHSSRKNLFSKFQMEISPIRKPDMSTDLEDINSLIQSEDGVYDVTLYTGSGMHACTFIKTGDNKYLFDPNYGLFECNKTNPSETILKVLDIYEFPRDHTTHKLEFVKVTSKTSER